MVNIDQIINFYNHIPLFLLILFRISSFIITFPIFSMTTVPSRVLVLISFTLSLLVWEIYPIKTSFDIFSLHGLEISLNQIFIGFISGFIFTIIFNMFIYFGEITAMQIGLGFASLIDPHITQINLIGQFYWLAVATLFILMNGHLTAIELLMKSFLAVPIQDATFSLLKIKTLISWSGIIFSGSLLISLPIILSLLIVNLIFSVVTRSVPQLNIFSMVFPIVLILGLIIIYLTFNIIMDDAPYYFEQGFDVLSNFILKK